MLKPPVAYRADTLRGLALAACASLPIWSCSVWGLPCPGLHNPSGALLPHLFTLTPAGLAVQANLKSPSGFSTSPLRGSRGSRGGIFSVALAVFRPSSPNPGRYPAHYPAEFGLSSPGSPKVSQPPATGSDRPAPLLCLFYADFNPQARRGSSGNPSTTAAINRRNSGTRFVTTPQTISKLMKKYPCATRFRIP